jgi:sulfate permease, SulP family
VKGEPFPAERQLADTPGSSWSDRWEAEFTTAGSRWYAIASMSARLSQLLPIAGWLPHYDRHWLRYDFTAGVATWAQALPQSLAYAHIAGLPPQTGIFVSFAAPLSYAFFGTSRQLVCGPSSSTAIISAVHIAPLVVQRPAEFAAMSAMLAIVCGLISLVLGLLKLGYVSQFIAMPVQVGFLFGLGLTIIAGQLFTLFGFSGVDGPFVHQLWHFATHLGATNGWTLAIGAGSLCLLLILGRVAPAVPAAILTAGLAIAIASVLGLDDRGVAVIGAIDRAFPTPSLPAVSPDQLPSLLPGALAIVLISSSESLTIARRFASEHRYEIRPDQEFVALGMSGIVTGLFHGFVTSGGATQSAANDRAGAKTQVSSLVLAGLSLLTVLALLPFVADLPLAVLGAIVITAVSGFLDVPALRRMSQVSRDGFVLALVALFGVLAVGILPGLLIAIVLSILVLLSRLSRPHATALVTPTGSQTVVESRSRGVEEEREKLLVIRPEGPLLFINALWVADDVKSRISAAQPPSVLDLDLEETPSLDFTSLDALADLRSQLHAEGIDLWLTNVHDDAQASLARMGSMNAVGTDWIYATNDAATSAFARVNAARNDAVHIDAMGEV